MGEPYDSAVVGLSGAPIEDERLGAAMLYTSGTTGRPKGLLRPLPDVAPDEPLSFMGFLVAICGYRSAPQSAVAVSIRTGSTAVIMEHSDAEARCALVQRHKVTHTQMVPTMFSRLLRLPDKVRTRYDLSSLEQIVCAADPCPVPIKAAMMDWVGPIIREYYGATEANGFTLALAEEWRAHPGPVGRAVPGGLEILDDDGVPCPTGVDGTVWFRGATNLATSSTWATP
jgi:long-chain acyl-CoA synthetase